jgi:hypothetical protein
MTASRLPALLAFVWASVVATFLYALLRGVQFVLYPEANPATVVWSAHSGYFWRMLIVGYAAGMTLFVAFALARRAPERAARWLLPALTVAAAAIALQAAFLP